MSDSDRPTSEFPVVPAFELARPASKPAKEGDKIASSLTHPYCICANCDHEGMDLVEQGHTAKLCCPKCGQSATLERNDTGGWCFAYGTRPPLVPPEGCALIHTDERVAKMGASASADQWYAARGIDVGKISAALSGK